MENVSKANEYFQLGALVSDFQFEFVQKIQKAVLNLGLLLHRKLVNESYIYLSIQVKYVFLKYWQNSSI